MVEVMAQAHSASIVLLLLLSAAFILARVVSLMLGPLLVDLAKISEHSGDGHLN